VHLQLLADLQHRKDALLCMLCLSIGEANEVVREVYHSMAGLHNIQPAICGRMRPTRAFLVARENFSVAENVTSGILIVVPEFFPGC